MTKKFERRHHSSWLRMEGLSPLAQLAQWMCDHPGKIAAAPIGLLIDAAVDVSGRLGKVAVREPTRRHRKHFAWLLGWQLLLRETLWWRA